MNKKGDSTKLMGVFFVAFISILIGLAIFTGAVAPAIGTVTSTFNRVNDTATFPTNGANITLNGQAVSNSSLLVVLTANGTVVPANNYTISNYVIVNGVFTSRLTGLASPYAGQSVNLSYTYEPVGYATDAGTRGVTGLILIFLALAIVATALVPAIRNGAMDLVRG